MAQTILYYYSGSTSSSFQSNGQIRVTYTASNGSVTITELEGGRDDYYGPSYNTSDKSVTITINGSSKSVSLGGYIEFANGLDWSTWDATDTSWSGLSSPGASNSDFNIKIKTPSNSSSSAYNDVTFSGTGTMSWSSYTVSYNANGGSGAPSSQTKYYNSTLTLSSTVPTRSGYTFLGWGTSASATSVAYAKGSSYTANSGTTLYAVWKKTITLTYNANNGTSAPSSQSATIYNATTSYKFTLSSTKPTRTGYTFLGWSTSSTATTSSYSAGGTITLSDSTTLYAVWRENYLTVSYYSNYADYFNSGSSYTPLNTVSATTNVKVYEYKFKYATAYNSTSTSEGLFNYSNSGGALYMTRTRYDATGYWTTTTAEDVELEGTKADKLTYTEESGTSGIAIGENMKFASGQALAEALGLTLESGDKSINLYANWVLLASRITVYQDDKTPIKGLLYICADDGTYHYGIMTVYDEDGNPREVI